MYKVDPNNNQKMIPDTQVIKDTYSNSTLPDSETLQPQPNFVIVNSTGYYAFLYPGYADTTFQNLTGTITSSATSSGILGQGTRFTEELIVGDTIKITSKDLSLVRINKVAPMFQVCHGGGGFRFFVCSNPPETPFFSRRASRAHFQHSPAFT